MSRTATITGDQLASALLALDVNFILSKKHPDAGLHKRPTQLIAALAESEEARLRLSLIPLFLEHPEFAQYVGSVTKRLSPTARLTLQCYYTAAIWLAQKYQHPTNLPDYFSKALGLQPTEMPEENLRALAKRHAELSGTHVNWLGTYEHAAQLWHTSLIAKQG